jgi:hypothetical protein
MYRMLEILKISVVAYVIFVLMSPGMIFHFYARLIDKIKWDWLYKPLGGCLMCFSGQVSFWYYLITHFREYNLFDHVVFISAVILIVMIFDKLIDYADH